VAALFWFLNNTRTGKSMRAFSDNEDLALLSGINPERVVAITWIIVAALATVAGVLYGLDKSFRPFTYFQLLLPIFAAAIVGGLGNPLGAIAGGFLIAFSEVTVTYAFRRRWSTTCCPRPPDRRARCSFCRPTTSSRSVLRDPDHRPAVPPDGPLQGEIGMSTDRPAPAACGRILLFVFVFGADPVDRLHAKLERRAQHREHGPDLGDHGARREHAVGLRGALQHRGDGLRGAGRAGAVIVSMPPTTEAWAAGGPAHHPRAHPRGHDDRGGDHVLDPDAARARRATLGVVAILVVGFFLFRYVFDGGVRRSRR
jgi:hypothetical protein